MSSNAIDISNIGSTEMYCTETYALETEFFQILQGKSEIKASENKLIFIRDGKENLIFVNYR